MRSGTSEESSFEAFVSIYVAENSFSCIYPLNAEFSKPPGKTTNNAWLKNLLCSNV